MMNDEAFSKPKGLLEWAGSIYKSRSTGVCVALVMPPQRTSFTMRYFNPDFTIRVSCITSSCRCLIACPRAPTTHTAALRGATREPPRCFRVALHGLTPPGREQETKETSTKKQGEKGMLKNPA